MCAPETPYLYYSCGCPTELISSYLDHVMAPLVRNLPSYIKDTKHALQIFQNIHFSGTHKFIFTMDVKSLYTVIPHHDGLRALKECVSSGMHCVLESAGKPFFWQRNCSIFLVEVIRRIDHQSLLQFVYC